ncbi:MAG TPA: ABC transporter ATP-binding protein, partial [Solirubrobacteraceae bacterium]|nr:ABC transporter ATP-binding protein [Solirubrobacteraceae bacterium]
MLELRELVKHYRVGEGEPIRAVDGVTMSIGTGELLALYGPSGSGKSTLLMLVAALLRPDSGAVLLDGREISALSEEEAARYRLYELGFISQTAELLPGARVIENAALKLWLSDRRGAEERVRPLLERLGLGQRLKHRSEQLSMGERQRLMIALALSMKPRLVLADEPTGSLDTQRSNEVLALLREVCREQQIAVLMVTHDPQATAFADRVLELRDGRLGRYEPSPTQPAHPATLSADA